ncbi:MAG: hypothetical protein IPO17_05300 [Flavobacteriales bacterium]|nr:hypothetical protein [Flavobacteriales bacterium]
MRCLYRYLTLAAVFGFMNCAAFAQLVSQYAYTQSVGTFSPIGGGSVLGTETNAAQKFVDPAVPAGGTTSTGVGLPIGFDFTFRGVTFDRFAVSTDGWISLGQSALGATAVNMPTTTVPLSTTTAVTPAQLRSRIAALGRDIRGKGSEAARIFGIRPLEPRQTAHWWCNGRITSGHQAPSVQMVTLSTSRSA